MITGCNDCMSNYEKGTKHVCNPRDIRETLQRVRTNCVRLETENASLRVEVKHLRVDPLCVEDPEFDTRE